jgi:hypothetical protein
MTESKSNAFDVFSADINTAHDFNVRLLRYTLLTVTEPEFNQSLRDQFCFEVCATESPHGVLCLTLAVNTSHLTPAICITPTFGRSQPNRFQNRVKPITVDVPL